MSSLLWAIQEVRLVNLNLSSMDLMRFELASEGSPHRACSRVSIRKYSGTQTLHSLQVETQIMYVTIVDEQGCALLLPICTTKVSPKQLVYLLDIRRDEVN